MRHWFANTEAVENRTPNTPASSPTPPVDRTGIPQYLWIDGVGGFRICIGEQWVFGQASPGNQADLTILGDLSRRAMAIRRSGRDYFIQPWQEIRVNQISIDRPAMLTDSSEILVGNRVNLLFRQPNPWSSTACLELISHHRWQPSVDGVILLADSIVLGPAEGSHVICPFWKNELILFRDGSKLFCRSSDPLQINQLIRSGEFELHIGDKVRGEDFSFGLE